MSEPPFPNVGQIWKLGDQYVVVTNVSHEHTSLVDPYPMLGLVEVDAVVPDAGAAPVFRKKVVKEPLGKHLTIDREVGQRARKHARDLLRNGSFVRYLGGMLTEHLFVCNSCGCTEEWRSYPDFGRLPPGWTEPDLVRLIECPECSRKGAAPKPPA
jgi:hypothetical protein